MKNLSICNLNTNYFSPQCESESIEFEPHKDGTIIVCESSKCDTEFSKPVTKLCQNFKFLSSELIKK